MQRRLSYLRWFPFARQSRFAPLNFTTRGMSDLTPIEKFQPCLLDRLTDDEPDKREESRMQRVVSLQKYRRGVLRDLEWLFNSHGYMRLGDESFDLKDYPEAWRSVINYGVRQLCGLSAPDLGRLQDELGDAIQVFEPRITQHGLTIHADQERNLVTLEVDGELWANPLPERLHLHTVTDIETGQTLMGDSPHG
jgi:type VI secretion system protein ImpF